MMWAGCWEPVKTSPGLATEGSRHPGPPMEGTVIETQKESLLKETFLPDLALCPPSGILPASPISWPCQSQMAREPVD